MKLNSLAKPSFLGSLVLGTTLFIAGCGAGDAGSTEAGELTETTTEVTEAAPSAPSAAEEDVSTPAVIDDQYVKVTFGEEQIIFPEVTWCANLTPENSGVPSAVWNITAMTEGREDTVTLDLAESSSESLFRIGLDLADTIMASDPAIVIRAAEKDEGLGGPVLDGAIVDGVGSGTATMENGLDGQGGPVDVTWEVSCNAF